ncbi:hypothetical protein AGMMS49938_08780 [Fibrobacterales bacterium]|nr:hypothetical protein AGMMS49938_08780 [Fibrobacterales bacterium]
MLKNQIAWVSGWASDISLWEDDIYSAFPNFSHRFIDYFDLIPNPDDFWDNNPRIAESEIVLGWSMGTLALLRNLHKKSAEQKWILLCPIADFCAKGCWSVSALRATKNAILDETTPNATEKALSLFAELMGTKGDENERWVENALRYTPEQLATGLAYLEKQIAPLSSAVTNLSSSVNANIEGTEFRNVELIFAELDKVVPLAQKLIFPDCISSKTIEGQGHYLPSHFGQLQFFIHSPQP